MRFQEILGRLTGISTGVFGVSWQPPEVEVTAARRVITFLEDRRVLYNPSELEVPAHCIESVLEIRRFLTDELMRMDSHSDLAKNLQAMRSACRKFLDNDTAHSRRSDYYLGGRMTPGHFASWVFLPALGDLRCSIGLHVALIAVRNGLSVEDELASILPGEPDDGGDIALSF